MDIATGGLAWTSARSMLSRAKGSASSLARVWIYLTALFAVLHLAEMASCNCERTSGDNNNNSLCMTVTSVDIAPSYTSVTILSLYTGGKV